MTNTRTTDYDIVIIGGGPAGLAAGLYAARARRKTVLLERKVTGGQIATTSTVENYPGLMEINGYDLGQAMQKQAESCGLEMAYREATAIERAHGHFRIRSIEGDLTAKAVILAGGADYNKLDIPGEESLTGFGVSYCATCDGAFFKEMDVAVVGGGDAALDEALFLTRYASKVTIIHRRDTLRAGAILQERARAHEKIDFIWNTIVRAVNGKDEVESLSLKNVVTGEETNFPASAVFIFIGQTPATGYLRGLVDLDGGGHVIVNEWMETSAAGIFAAGDIRNNSSRQVVSAAGDGATAAIRADQYISHLDD